MAIAKWRREFYARMGREGWPVERIDLVLRHAATLHRLAEAQCNGDWPADNGERRTVECETCGGSWAAASMRKTGCPDCRAEAGVRRALPEGWRAIFAGDPRGCVVRLVHARAYGLEHAKDAEIREGINAGIVREIGVPS